jgi:sRNA-binding carbon storage regulator CsrA
MSKLSLSLKPESPLTLILPNGKRVEITITKASKSRIRVVVDAPPEVRILRQVDYSSDTE